MGKVLSISEKFITAAEGNDEVVLKVTGMVGMDFTGMDLAGAVEFYEKETGKTVRIEMDSVGGFVSDAFAFYDQVRAKQMRPHVDGYGMVASAATIIMAAAGKKRSRLSPNAEYLVHNASGGDADSLERANKKMAVIYAELTGKTEKDMRAMMKEDKPISAQEAKKRGFVGEVIELQRLAAQHKEDMAETTTAKQKFKLSAKQRLHILTNDEIELDVTLDKDLADEVGTLKAELKTKGTEVDELKAEVQLKDEAVAAKDLAVQALKDAEAEHATALEAYNKEVERLKAEIVTLKTKPVDPKVKATATPSPDDTPDDKAPKYPKLTAEQREKMLAEKAKEITAAK